ncbi:DMT family transporter [Cystobacter fuscus]|uniref:DMT family transporter n=1 Tax=Cystobacter fuscus TaxID=43 RepID=UPI002B2E3842|nr:DMT family transporter [Cystobacter fuscus]
MSTPLVTPGPRATLERLQVDGVLLLMNALWGVTFVMVKDALGHGDPFSFLGLRFCIGALTLSALARRKMLERATLLRGGALGVLLFLCFAMQTLGLVSTTPSRSAFITGTYVVLVPVLGWAFFRRMSSASSWAGVAIATAGLYTLTGANLREGLSLGDVLTLGSAAAYAFHILFTERIAAKTDVVSLVAVQLWVVALLSVLCLPFAGARVHWTPSFVGAALFCGVAASALALTLQVWAQARTTAVRVALFCCTEPVFAALTSVGVGHERLGPREWVGGGLIVLGVLVAEVSGVLWARFFPGRASAPTGG